MGAEVAGGSQSVKKKEIYGRVLTARLEKQSSPLGPLTEVRQDNSDGGCVGHLYTVIDNKIIDELHLIAVAEGGGGMSRGVVSS